eukprot:399499_1
MRMVQRKMNQNIHMSNKRSMGKWKKCNDMRRSGGEGQILGQEGSSVSSILRRLLLPSLAKLSAGRSQPRKELEKNLLDRIEKMISCNSIASFAMCEEADEDSSDSDDNEDTVVSPIDLSNPFTETDLRSLFKALSSPLSCASIPENPTNNVSSDGIDADFDAVLSSVDLTEKCRETLKEIKKISSLENVSTTRPSLSRSINGLGPSTPDVVDSTQKSSSAPGTSVSSPTDNDIMLGKGAISNNHPGNIRFRETVESMKP